MAKIKFFQQNSSLQACSSKPGSGESSSARQHNYRAIRGVNFSSSPAQHLFSPLQSSVKASNSSFVPNNSHWLNYHQQEHCAALQPAGIWEWCLKAFAKGFCILISGRILHFLEKLFSPWALPGEMICTSDHWPCWYPGDDTHVSAGLCKHPCASGESIQTGQCSLKIGAALSPPLVAAPGVPVCGNRNRKSLFPSMAARGPAALR